MPRIEIVTSINAPPERCFWLALSADAHAVSARQTQEQIVGGGRGGLLRLGDFMTFRARPLGVWQTLTSQITALQAPTYFRDEMRQGAFKSMWHAHYFEQQGSRTLMRDVFEFTSPLGVLGHVADWLVLTSYLRRFLAQRGRVLRQLAEGEGWREFLPVTLLE